MSLLDKSIKRRDFLRASAGAAAAAAAFGAAHSELRGKDEWERITWDEALTYITDGLKRVYAEYGQMGVVVNG